MILHVKNEVDTLKAVVLGQPKSMGPKPSLEETYDAKSYESVLNNTYPNEADITQEMNGFEQVLKKYGVQVFRPWAIPDCNQVFARDVAFVIDDKLIISNIIPDRADEQEAYELIFNSVSYNKIYNLPEKAHVEGGDVILHDDIIFMGVCSRPDYSTIKTARTNTYAADFIRELFPYKTIKTFELIKDDKNPKKGILHLDCTFQPVGRGKAIIYKEGFVHEKDYHFLVEFFGKENIFELNNEEMYLMCSNVFSISPDVVVSESNFTRLNHHLENEWGLKVEAIPYFEISKMGGLLRCSTLPLIRE